LDLVVFCNFLQATLRQEGLLKKVRPTPVQDTEPSVAQDPGERMENKATVVASSRDTTRGQSKESLKAVMEDIKSLTSEMFEDNNE
jgi:hypothetical protein